MERGWIPGSGSPAAGPRMGAGRCGSESAAAGLGPEPEARGKRCSAAPAAGRAQPCPGRQRRGRRSGSQPGRGSARVRRRVRGSSEHRSLPGPKGHLRQVRQGIASALRTHKEQCRAGTADPHWWQRKKSKGSSTGEYGLRMRCHREMCSDKLTRILLLSAQNMDKKWAGTNQKLVAMSRDQLSG